jgi:hypothetical protein
MKIWTFSIYCFQGDQKSFDNFAGAMLHGNGSNRWFDKSFNLVITPNGRVRYIYVVYFTLKGYLRSILNNEDKLTIMKLTSFYSLKIVMYAYFDTETVVIYTKEQASLHLLK